MQKTYIPIFRIKQLNWRTQLNCTYAVTNIAKYTVLKYRGTFALDVTHYTPDGFGGALSKEIGGYSTIEKAQLAAQQHYEQLILESIE